MPARGLVVAAGSDAPRTLFLPRRWSGMSRVFHAPVEPGDTSDFLRVAALEAGSCLGVACARLHGGASAWLEWLALDDQAQGTVVLRLLIDAVCAWSRSCGATELCAMDVPFSWLGPYWRDLGFTRVDALLNYVLDGAQVRPQFAPAWVRPATRGDLDRIVAIDADAFDPRMRFSARQLEEYYEPGCAMHVAEPAAVVDGYVAATCTGGRVHIARLAVATHARRAGVARALMATALAAVAPDGVVSLNTPVGADSARQLYRSLGFVQEAGDYSILGRRLA